jgi:hypothetical protein
MKEEKRRNCNDDRKPADRVDESLYVNSQHAQVYDTSENRVGLSEGRIVMLKRRWFLTC